MNVNIAKEVRWDRAISRMPHIWLLCTSTAIDTAALTHLTPIQVNYAGRG